MSKHFVWLAVGGLALVAIITNPSLDQHKREFEATLAQAKQNAASSFSFKGWLALSAIDLARSGHYESHLIMSEYHVVVAGREMIRCTGMFGQVGCYVPDR